MQIEHAAPDYFNLTVKNVVDAVRFYENALGFQTLVYRIPEHALLKRGKTVIRLRGNVEVKQTPGYCMVNLDDNQSVYQTWLRCYQRHTCKLFSCVHSNTQCMIVHDPDGNVICVGCE